VLNSDTNHFKYGFQGQTLCWRSVSW